MNNIDNRYSALLFCVLLVIWGLLILAVVKKSRCGALLLKISEKRTATHMGLGISMVLVCGVYLSIPTQFTIVMRALILLGYATAAVEFFYFGVTKIQFRELGLVYNNFSTKYVDIEAYEWETPEILTIKRAYSIKKTLKIMIKPADKKNR